MKSPLPGLFEFYFSLISYKIHPSRSNLHLWSHPNIESHKLLISSSRTRSCSHVLTLEMPMKPKVSKCTCFFMGYDKLGLIKFFDLNIYIYLRFHNICKMLGNTTFHLEQSKNHSRCIIFTNSTMCMQLNHVYNKRCDPHSRLLYPISIKASVERSACI